MCLLEPMRIQSLPEAPLAYLTFGLERPRLGEDETGEIVAQLCIRTSRNSLGISSMQIGQRRVEELKRRCTAFAQTLGFEDLLRQNGS